MVVSLSLGVWLLRSDQVAKAGTLHEV
jgi:hypothetical protein